MNRVTWMAIPVMSLALACASNDAPQRASISQELTLESSVRAVNPETRQITLHNEDGSDVVIVAGPDVVNFDQIEVGDTVRAQYRETLAAERLDPDEPTREPMAEVAVAQAEPGEKPGAGVAAGAAVTVTVQSVDHDQHIVVFSDESGALQTVRAQQEEGQAFVAGLKTGDRVQLVYSEAIAITVEE